MEICDVLYRIFACLFMFLLNLNNFNENFVRRIPYAYFATLSFLHGHSEVPFRTLPLNWKILKKGLELYSGNKITPSMNHLTLTKVPISWAHLLPKILRIAYLVHCTSFHCNHHHNIFDFQDIPHQLSIAILDQDILVLLQLLDTHQLFKRESRWTQGE